LNDEIHPDDLKKSVSNQINALLQPIRDHFKNNPEAKKLLELVKSYQVTR
jgi:tyrosyl-tRNA synthetase